MNVLVGGTLRDIVTKVNSLNIQRTNIVTLLKEDGQYCLVYYTEKGRN